MVCRGLFGHRDLDQRPSRIAKPEAVAFEAGRWIDDFDAVLLLDSNLQIRKVVRIAAERDVVQPLARSRHHRAPRMRIAERLELERSAGFPYVEAEVRIEALCGCEIRHGNHELIERMDAEGAALGRRRDVATYCSHRSLPKLFGAG